MRYTPRAIWVLAIVASTVSASSWAQEEELQIVSQSVDGIPTFVTGNLGTVTPLGPVDSSLRASQERSFLTAARSYLQSFVVRYMSAQGGEELVPSVLIRDQIGLAHLRFTQSINGLRVYGAELLVHAEAATGQVYLVNGEFAPNDGPAVAGTISAQEAIASAINDIGLSSYHILDKPELCYVLTSSDDAVLAWRQLVRYEAERLVEVDHVFADAISGGMVARHPTIFTAKRWQTFDARNGSSLPGVLLCTNDEPCGDEVAELTHDNTSHTYDYYSQKFGRDSIDGQGLNLRSTVHYQVNYNNAFWDGSQMVYGDGDGNALDPLGNALDVVAHELTHGVTQYESGLIYQNESGALNEALSDIFSAAVEAWIDQGINSNTWKLGEDVYTPGISGDALRYMNNPTQDNSSYDHYPERYTGSADNGGGALELRNRQPGLLLAGRRRSPPARKDVVSGAGARFVQSGTDFLPRADSIFDAVVEFRSRP